MQKFKKIFGSLLAASMVLSSFGAAVSADSEVVFQYVTENYGYTLYDDGTLDYKMYKGDKWGCNTYLSSIDEEYLPLIKTVNIDFSEFDKQSYVSFRYSLHGANCDAEQINIITSDTFYFREIVICDFPSIDGEEDCINLSEKAHCESYRFTNVGLETLDVLSKFNPAIYTIEDCEELETVVVPAGVQVISFESGNVSEIDFSACANTLESFGIHENSNITSFDLSDLSGLEYFSFRNCENLSDITLPDYITLIQYGAFLDCKSLKSIELPDSVVSISSNAFAGTGLESIVIPEGVDEINPGTFKDCYSLKNIYIPSSVTRIAANAFDGDNSIKTVNFGGTEEEWNEITVDHYDPEQDVVVEDKMKDVFNDMFGDPVLYCNVDGIDGWREDGDSWLYYDENGAAATEWKKVNGKWFYFDEDGIMQTNWQKIDGEWYYFGYNGAMRTGPQEISGRTYIFESSGVLQTGWHKDDLGWYYCGDDGAMKNGWVKDGNNWYYIDKAFYYLVFDFQTIDGVTYFFDDETGAMATGWTQIGGSWFLFESNGKLVTGWYKSGSTYYYLDEESGIMYTGWQEIDGVWYYFKPDGAMASNEYCGGYWLSSSGAWTYKYKASWKQDSTGWWYGDTNGWYAKNETLKIDGKDYTFNAAGYWVET